MLNVSNSENKLNDTINYITNKRFFIYNASVCLTWLTWKGMLLMSVISEGERGRDFHTLVHRFS